MLDTDVSRRCTGNAMINTDEPALAKLCKIIRHGAPGLKVDNVTLHGGAAHVG